MTAVRPEHLYDRHAGADDLPADGITRASGMAPRPPGKVPAPQENHGGQMTTMIRRITRQLSVPTTLLATTCAAAGTVTGLFIYLDRSPIRHKYLPGSSAYWQQAAIAGVALLLYGYSWWRHQRRPGHQPGRLLLLAPLGKPAARRFARTMRQAVRSPSGFARAVATLPFTGLLIYCAWRIGEQITAGLDPNWTVNAWGGPSYFGAMACHYLDGGLLMAAAAWLLGKILLPDPASTAHCGTPAPTVSRLAAHQRQPAVQPAAHRNYCRRHDARSR